MRFLLIILIMLASLFWAWMYISRGLITNIFMMALIVILLISFLICLIYLIGQITNNSTIKSKFQVLGDNSGFFCIGIFVIFIVFASLGNMTDNDSTHVEGQVQLDEGYVKWVSDGGKVEKGYWVYKDSGEPTGKKEYNYYEPKISQKISFNIKNIKWDHQFNETKLNKALNTDGFLGKTIVKLYDKDGNYLNQHEARAISRGDEIIINDSFSFDKPEMDKNAIKYVEVELTLKNTNATARDPDNYYFHILSDRHEIS